MTKFPISNRAPVAIPVLVVAYLVGVCSEASTDTGTAPPAVLSLISGDDQSGTVGQALDQLLVAEVTTWAGAAVADVTVSWAVTGGGGSLSASSVPTDAQGRTSVAWTLGTAAGRNNNTVTASVTGLTGSPVRFTASAAAGPPAQLVFVSGDNQTGPAGQPLPEPLVVATSDDYENPASGVTVTYTVTAGGGSLSASSAMTDAQGEASVTWTLGPAGGTNNNTVEASVEGLSGSPVTFTASAEPAPVVYTDPAAFEAATADFGVPTVVDFDDIDARPVNNSIDGRAPFDGDFYAGRGIRFSNPNSFPLFIAPGGLSWNASNSLSVAHFPFDPLDPAPYDEDDDLSVSLDPACRAVAFVFVDNGTRLTDEFVQFISADGRVVLQVGFPANYQNYRAFLGIVSVERPVAKINILEAANDRDDVNYDEFTCFIP